MRGKGPIRRRTGRARPRRHRGGVRDGWPRPATEDDSLVRFALDAVGVYVDPGRTPRSSGRCSSAELLKGARSAARRRNQGFSHRRAPDRRARAEIVQPLNPLLWDPELCGPAAKAMVIVGTPEAEDALLKAFFPVSAKTAGSLVKALGELRSRRSIPCRFGPLHQVRDEILRESALDALANIGDPGSRPVLETIAVAASPYERAKAARRFLLYAQRLWESGETDSSGNPMPPFPRQPPAAGRGRDSRFRAFSPGQNPGERYPR